MAKRNYRKSSKKIQPSEMTLTFEIDKTGVIDLSQCISLVNRRFYRQGLNWAVSDFKFLFSSQPGVDEGVTVSIDRLPTTWVMSNAWEKGFRAWQKMNMDAIAETPSVKPKFLDFKIYADNQHQAEGFGKNLLPSTSSINYVGSTSYNPGEWISSKIHVPFGPSSPGNTTDLEIMAVGKNYVGGTTPVVSLIEGYANSRGLPYTVDPNVPTESVDADGSTPENWLSALANDGLDQDSEVIDDMITENNQAPYPYEGDGNYFETMYPGGASNASGLTRHDTAFITNTTVGGTTHLKGGSFPCGLLRINNPGELVGILQISLVPGTHRGYLAETMVDM